MVQKSVIKYTVNAHLVDMVRGLDGLEGPPSLFPRRAFLFGAVDGGVEQLLTRLKNNVLGENKGKVPDAIQFTFMILLRYAIAKQCNKYLGTNISSELVHVFTISAILDKTSPELKSNAQFAGFKEGIMANVFSIFMSAPTFGHAFRLGYSHTLVKSITGKIIFKAWEQIEKKDGMDEKNKVYQQCVVDIASTILSCYCCVKVLNKYLKLNVPYNYLKTQILLASCYSIAQKEGKINLIKAQKEGKINLINKTDEFFENFESSNDTSIRNKLGEIYSADKSGLVSAWISAWNRMKIELWRIVETEPTNVDLLSTFQQTDLFKNYLNPLLQKLEITSSNPLKAKMLMVIDEISQMPGEFLCLTEEKSPTLGRGTNASCSDGDVQEAETFGKFHHTTSLIEAIYDLCCRPSTSFA